MRRERVVDICRWVLGSVFTFSGIVKSVDPVGTSVFVEKYLATYSLEALLPAALPIAIVLAVVEFTLGELLLSGRAHRATAVVTLIFTLLFTLITLLSATILPIGDCGCFGDAVRLTPMQTLLKNLVLLPMAVLLCLEAKPRRFNYLSLTIAVAISLGVNLFALRYLPIIDFMPYGKGVNVVESVERDRAIVDAQRNVSLVFRSVTTGEEHLFSSDDIACWQDEDLEYVGTRESEVPTTDALPFADLVISDVEGEDVTLELLGRDSLELLCIYDARSARRHAEAISRFISSHDDAVVLAAYSPEGFDVECYRVDAMTLRSMIRSKVGVITLRRGVIVRKSDIRDC